MCVSIDVDVNVNVDVEYSSRQSKPSTSGRFILFVLYYMLYVRFRSFVPLVCRRGDTVAH